MLAPAVNKAISPSACFLVQESCASSSDLKAPSEQRGEKTQKGVWERGNIFFSLTHTHMHTHTHTHTHTHIHTHSHTQSYQLHWNYCHRSFLAWLVPVNVYAALKSYSVAIDNNATSPNCLTVVRLTNGHRYFWNNRARKHSRPPKQKLITKTES